MRGSHWLFAPIAGIVLTALADRVASGAEVPKPSGGSVRLSSGALATYHYHFNRNALRGSVGVAGALVALTRSGNLLRFDLERRRFDREHFESARATCLGRSDFGLVLAGFEDGRICRIDPATLEVSRPIAKVADRPTWIGAFQGGATEAPRVVVVTEEDEAHDLASGRTYKLPEKSTAFLLDRRRRLWIGSDRGEWGGACDCLDLASGKLTAVDGPKGPGSKSRPTWSGLYGFLERRDGQVWAFGGTWHMWYRGAFIARVDRLPADRLYDADNGAKIKDMIEGRPIPRAERPLGPITHLVETPRGQLAAVSLSEPCQTDAALGKWEPLPMLEIRYRWGRPDAVGAYPAVVAVHAVERPAVALLFATERDGYWQIADGKLASLACPGQLEAEKVDRIESTAEGMLFFDGTDESPAWRPGAEGWTSVDLAPEFRANPAEDQDPDEPDEGSTWEKTGVLVGPRGTITTLSESPSGRLTTARRTGGRSRILNENQASLDPSDTFITPDGEIWGIDDGVLMRLDGKRWERLGPAVGVGPPAESWSEARSRWKAIGAQGPPWCLLDRASGRLLELSYGTDPGKAAVRPLKATEHDRDLRATDAVPWGRGSLLLATEKGLRTCERASGKLADPALPSPREGVATLCRDGLGRLWMGGAGLWLVGGDGKTLHDLSGLPMTGHSCSVTAMAADPERPHGVIVSFGERGVVWVDVPETEHR